MENIKVQILDTTLREGEQTPGVSFKISQKIEIVKLLNRFGVDFIEVGHPIVSKDIYSFIEKVSKLNLNSKIIAHSRLLKADIDQIIDLNVPWIGLFFDISEDHLEKKYGLNEEKALEMIIDSISYAKRNKLNVRFTAEDASRTNLELEKIKTTNINILLNRVRLDKKRTLKKRIIFSLTLITISSLLAIYFIL